MGGEDLEGMWAERGFGELLHAHSLDRFARRDFQESVRQPMNALEAAVKGGLSPGIRERPYGKRLYLACFGTGRAARRERERTGIRQRAYDGLETAEKRERQGALCGLLLWLQEVDNGLSHVPYGLDRWDPRETLELLTLVDAAAVEVERTFADLPAGSYMIDDSCGFVLSQEDTVRSNCGKIARLAAENTDRGALEAGIRGAIESALPGIAGESRATGHREEELISRHARDIADSYLGALWRIADGGGVADAMPDADGGRVYMDGGTPVRLGPMDAGIAGAIDRSFCGAIGRVRGTVVVGEGFDEYMEMVRGGVGAHSTSEGIYMEMRDMRGRQD